MSVASHRRPTRSHTEQCPLGRIDLWPRDNYLIYEVFRHRALRTTHLIDLFSGGETIRLASPGEQAVIIGGPKDVAGERFWRVTYDSHKPDMTGWVSEDVICRHDKAAFDAATSPGTIVSNLRPAYVRPRPGGSPQKVRRRARDLFDHNYFQRLDEPLKRRSDRIPGSAPKIIALGNASTTVLAEIFGIYLGPGVRWNEKNQNLGDASLKHTLGIADLLVPLKASCQARDGLRYLDAQEFLAHAPDTTKHDPQPFAWRAAVPGKRGTYTLRSTPDASCAVEASWLPEQQARRHFISEIDLGTEPNARRLGQMRRQSSIRRKFLVYGLARKQRYHRERFGIPGFRVPFITTSPKRITHMLELLEKLAADYEFRRDHFLFTDFSSLADHWARCGDLFTMPWQNGEGKRVTLFD